MDVSKVAKVPQKCGSCSATYEHDPSRKDWDRFNCPRCGEFNVVESARKRYDEARIA